MFDGIDWGTEETQRKIEQIKFNKLIGKVLYISIICLLVGVVFWISGATTMMQRNTLKTQNLQQLEINDLSNKIDNMEYLYQNDKKAVETDTESLTSLSKNDRELIERVCMAESNSIEGMMAVAQVIQDRAILWNMTPFEVVTQESQFAEPVQGEITAEAVQAVWAVFDEGMRAFEDSNVTHFYAENSQEPYWTANKNYVGEMGGNLFYESRY